MAKGSDIAIRIGADFVGKKAFKQADGAVTGLIKSTAKLAGSFLTLQKAQQSMNAYMQDEKATKVLANNLKNLGLGFATQSAEEFISVLQKQTGILDDELRPAYAQLARVTGSTLETQKLMSLAFDVSAGTGQNYSQVIDALSQAYVGNNKGLKALNIGLTQADLKTKSFADITEILNKQFKGSGEASLDSYAGKMALLQVAAADASETIGKSLLDAIAQASGPNGFQSFIKSIQSAANLIGDLATGTGRLIALIDIAASPSKGIGDILKKYRALRQQWDREDLAIQRERSGIANNTSSYMQKQAKDAINAAKTSAVQKKLEADRLAILKKTTAEKKAQAVLDKANAVLQTATEKFDEQGIQIQAALLNAGKLTTEELYRLSLKKAIYDLEQALVSEDQKRIAAATAVLEKLNAQWNVLGHAGNAAKVLGTNMAAIGTDNKLVDINNLNDALEILKKMLEVWLQMQGGIGTGGKTTTTGTTGGKPNLPPLIADGGLTGRGLHNLPPLADSPLEIYTQNLAGAMEVIAKNNESLKPIVESGLFDLYYNATEFMGGNINPFQMTEGQGTAYSQSQSPINVTVNGAIDPEGVARTIVDVLSRSYGRGALPNQLLIL